MSLFDVNREKCIRDGICVEVCPMGVIELKDDHPTPTPSGDADRICIRCGHCVAACPEGAFSHAAMRSEECPPVRTEWIPDPGRMAHLLRYRRSIRTYRPEPLRRNLITRLIEMARFAPSGHNVQPVHWRVIYDTEEVHRLSGRVIDWMRHLMAERAPLAEQLHMDRIVRAWERGIDRICRGAPHVVVAHAPKDERTAPAACTIALAYVELAAPSLGLGACWAGYFNAAAAMWPPMMTALDLPAGHAAFGAMMVGYPKYRYHRLPLRNDPPITWR